MPRRFLPLSKQPMAKTCVGAILVSRDFYLDPPGLVAQKLLGKLLVRGGGKDGDGENSHA